MSTFWPILILINFLMILLLKISISENKKYSNNTKFIFSIICSIFFSLESIMSIAMGLDILYFIISGLLAFLSIMTLITLFSIERKKFE